MYNNRIIILAGYNLYFSDVEKQKNKITYTQQSDYLLPDLRLPERPKVELEFGASGIYGILRSIT